MPDTFESLVHGYLDDHLTAEQFQALCDQLRTENDQAQRFVEICLLHDRLRDVARVERSASLTSQQRATPRAWQRRVGWAGLAAAIVVTSLVLLQSFSPGRIDAAEAQLDRLIVAARQLGDRTYRIQVLDSAARSDTVAIATKGRPQPPIDGALLHLRGVDQYVLLRDPDGPSVFATGSNGRESWSIPPDGPVRVSPDPSRFRGALPGEQQDLPFIDLPSSLTQLREAYSLEILVDGAGRHLKASKRSAAFRGPRDVEIWFDAKSGLIERMRLAGLPQARGGPRSLVLERLDSHSLPPDFFDHQAHHTPNRRIIEDER